MSKPRYGWWSYAKHMVRKYPELKKEYDRLHTQRVTTDTTRIPGSGLSRSAENTVLKQLPPGRQKEFDAVCKAIEMTRMMQTGKERLAVIDMVLWKGTHNIAGAAMKLYISEITATRYHGDFIRLVGFCYGLEGENATAHVSKNAM